jgi:hypothetical protein
VSLAAVECRAKEFELAAFLGPKGELYVEDNVSDIFWCAAGQESARPRREGQLQVWLSDRNTLLERFGKSCGRDQTLFASVGFLQEERKHLAHIGLLTCSNLLEYFLVYILSA